MRQSQLQRKIIKTLETYTEPPYFWLRFEKLRDLVADEYLGSRVYRTNSFDTSFTRSLRLLGEREFICMERQSIGKMVRLSSVQNIADKLAGEENSKVKIKKRKPAKGGQGKIESKKVKFITVKTRQHPQKPEKGLLYVELGCGMERFEWVPRWSDVNRLFIHSYMCEALNLKDSDSGPPAAFKKTGERVFNHHFK